MPGVARVGRRNIRLYLGIQCLLFVEVKKEIPDQTMAHKIIQQLMAVPGLKVECPHCFGEFLVKRGKLFSMYDTYPSGAQKIIRERFRSGNELKEELKERKHKLVENRKKKTMKITVSAQACNFGKIAEQIVPALLTFT